jgi:N-acetylneuraminic acid mutarotase
MKNKAAIASLTLLLVGLLAVCGVIAAKRFEAGNRRGKWTAASSNGFAPRCWFTSSVVHGKIYVIGGYGDSTLATTLDVFDPATNAWHTVDSKGTFTERASLASCVFHDKIYVFGGAIGPEKPSNMSSALEIFDPVTSSWSTPITTGSLTPRNNLCACLVGGKIYTLGGYNAQSPGDVNTFEMFDPVTNTWSTPTTHGIFTPHGAFTANVVDGKIYVIGGFNDQAPRGHRVLGNVEVFDPAANSWSDVQTTGTFTARLLHSSGVVDGKIYIIGGTPDLRNPLTKNVVQVFDPKTNAWNTPESTGTFTPRSYLSSSVVGDKIYAIGGQDTSQVFSKIEVYEP